MAQQVIPFRTAYDNKRTRVSVDFTDTETMTEQCHKQDCDINTIIKRYDKTGLITHVNKATAEYGDYTTVNEYQQSMQLVIDAENAFSEIPSNIRKKFGNDAGAFFEFATDPNNHDKMVEMGLANAPIAPTIQKVEVINSTPATDVITPA